MSLFSRSLIKTLGIYSFGNIINAAIPFFLLPFLTNYLTPNDYGIIAIFQVILNFTNPISGISINGAITRQYYSIKDNRNLLGRYVTNALYILIFFTSIALIIFFVFGEKISLYSGFPSNWLWVVLVCSFSHNMIEVLLSIWRVKLKAVNYVLFRFLRTIIELVLSILLILYINKSWESRVEGQLYSSLFFAIFALFFLWKMKLFSFSFKVSKFDVKDILRFGIPLIPHAIGAVFITMADRIFITNMISIEETGLYAVGFQVSQIIALIQISFNQAWVPFFYGKLKEESSSINLKLVKITYLYFGFLLILVLLLTFLSPYIYSIFIGEKFGSSIIYVFYIALGFAFNGMYKMVVNYFFYLKKTKFIGIITILTAGLNIVFNYALILEFGAIGCAYATTLSFFLQFIIVWYFSSKNYSMPWFFFLKQN